MGRLSTLSFLLAALLCTAATAQQPETPPKRVALVIGNADYDHAPSLMAPANDAAAMIRKLQDLKFDVIGLPNRNLLQMRELIAQFRAKLVGADQALFYYSGHGAQIGEDNYLLATDSDTLTASNFASQTINVNEIYQALADGDSGFNLVILDACRTNPFFSKSSADQPTGGWKDGLVEPQGVPAGTIVAFATSPGGLADDVGATTDHSPYSFALLHYMGEPGLAIQDFFLRVHQEFNPQQQVPWENTSQKTPFLFRDGAFLDVTIDNGDDELSILVNGQTVRLGTDRGRTRKLTLAPGENLLSVNLFNQKTTRGVVGAREGWSYSARLQVHGVAQPSVTLQGGEPGLTDPEYQSALIDAVIHGKLQLGQPFNPPGQIVDHHWGHEFPTAFVRINVDRDSGRVTIADPNDQVWKDEFAIIDGERDVYDLALAWCVAHQGIPLFDDATPGVLRPLQDLRTNCIAAHNSSTDSVGKLIRNPAHDLAIDKLAQADEAQLTTAVNTMRTKELDRRGQLVFDVNDSFQSSLDFRGAARAEDVAGMRRLFHDLHQSNPEVRNSLALISNGELLRLVASLH